MSRRDRGLLAIFRAPLVLAALSLTGLIGALLRDGAWDWIGAILLATTMTTVVRARLRPLRSRTQSNS
jgi:hypothetical protein